MKKKLMILGAGVFQLPVILRAKELGVFTIACSYYSDDPGMAVVDRFYNVSTVDKESVLEIARKEKINGIMTIASEASAPTVAYVAEKLGLSGYTYKAVKTIANKFLLRVFLKKNGFLVPKFEKALNLRQAISAYKKMSNYYRRFIMKPLESSGSRGIFLIRNERDLKKNFKIARDFSFFEKGVIIEEYLDGVEIGGECLIYRGELIFSAITNKYKNKFFVPIGHSMPSKLEPEIQKKVKKTLEKYIKDFKLSSGALNFDIMIVNSDPVIIELGGRLGGNLLPELMKFSTGVDTVEASIKMSLGEKPRIIPKPQKGSFGYKILGSNKEGFLKNINIDGIKRRFTVNIVDIRCNKNIGDKIEVFNQGSHQIGYFKVKGESIKEIENTFNKIDRLLKIEFF